MLSFLAMATTLAARLTVEVIPAAVNRRYQASIPVPGCWCVGAHSHPQRQLGDLATPGTAPANPATRSESVVEFLHPPTPPDTQPHPTPLGDPAAPSPNREQLGLLDASWLLQVSLVSAWLWLCSAWRTAETLHFAVAVELLPTPRTFSPESGCQHVGLRGLPPASFASCSSG